MYRILLVEDDPVIASLTGEHLTKWGYEIKTVADFSAVLSDFTGFEPHLVLMDIGLPFYNGYYWCAEIRKISQVPIIFISSASDNMNIVMAVNMGGDDFISKPFDLEVLSAKVQAILRRTYAFTGASSVLEYEGVILNMADMSLVFEGKRIELSKNEFRILQILFEQAGNIVSRDNIMKRLWDNECFVDDNTLTVNVNRLRKVLEEGGLKDFIMTKKGVGYQLNRRSGQEGMGLC
ncbi:MAG: response regulator transcription factor [Roseburia sp.]|nr:response regulator transcription factor [Roseburia sp.]MCM1243622.1 response regulator transcription factor [Roseburia sp.]